MVEQTAGIEMDVREGLAILRPWGTLDIGGAEQIRPHIDVMLGSGHRSILVDLQHVHFIDASGLRELLRVRDLIRAQGGQVSIINGRPQVKRFLDVIGRLGCGMMLRSPSSLGANPI